MGKRVLEKMHKDIKFVIDSHVHFGENYSYKEYFAKIKKTPIKSAVAFPLASDIYQRSDKKFGDNETWKKKRRNVNKSILSLADQIKKIKIYPFKFMWNDFNREDLDRYFGIKCQRRDVDAEYKISSPKFMALLDKLKEMNMPIIFEDEFDNTMKFLNEWAKEINVIIPHLGFGSQSYDNLKDAKIWEKENVYTDTSYISDVDISGDIIKKYIEGYGHERILFGSDYPFSEPQEELEKILSLDISEEAKEAITSKNILRLMERVRK